jgi:Flp pilus assembly protein TadD
MQKSRSLVVISVFLLGLAAGTARAGDLRITLPKRSKPTPVQQLNRDGVKAIEKHDYDKAKKLFYKAYLLDPNDPFTLNNLGFIAELEGEVERAQRYYALAAEQNSDALVDQASAAEAEGKPISKVAGTAETSGMQINRINVQAIALLNKDRAAEADLLLQKALALDAKNAFTLNNLGYAKEKEGEFEAALNYYTQAAQRNSGEPVVVTVNSEWRGQAISSVAANNATNVRRLMERAQDRDARVARLNLQGVSALNRNDRRAARQYFEQAYKLDPSDAFTMNNMGYLAELDGDRETADFYYDRAREANRNSARVTVATRKEAEGRRVAEVAGSNDQKVQDRIEIGRQARQRQGGQIQLKRRDNTPVVEPEAPTPQLKQREPSSGQMSSAGQQTLEPAPILQPDNTLNPATPAPGTQSPAQTAPGLGTQPGGPAPADRPAVAAPTSPSPSTQSGLTTESAPSTAPQTAPPNQQTTEPAPAPGAPAVQSAPSTVPPASTTPQNPPKR